MALLDASDHPGSRPGEAAFAAWLGRLPAGAAIVALTALGLVFRIAFVQGYRLAGVDRDACGYMDVAHHIASGAGFMTNIYRYLFVPPAHLPQPDAHWSPLLPLLTAAAFRLWGESVAAAHAVPLLFGIAVPPLVYALGRTLGAGRRIALFAGLLAAVHPTLVTWSLRVVTEMGTIALCTTCFVLMPRTGRRSTLLLGPMLGLAWLMKYQSGLLWAGVLLQFALARRNRQGIRDLGIVATLFALTISPWLIRNALVFGDPFYTDLRLDVISSYRELGGFQHVWARLTPPPAPLAFMLGHPLVALEHAYGSLRAYYYDLPREAGGSALLTPFALLGVLAMARHWRRWAPLVLYGVVLVAMFSISTPMSRYLFSLIPPWLVLAAAGMMWAGDLARRLARWPGAALRVTMAVVMLAACADEARRAAVEALDRTSAWNPSKSYYGLEVMAAAEFIRAHTGPDEPILAVEVYVASYMIGRPAINVPFDPSVLLALRVRWRPAYLVITDRDRAERLPGWAEDPPGWAHPVWRRGPEEIARMLAAGSFEHLSPVTIYRLDPPG